ncbi:MAG: RNA polymerase sigma factor [Crocinitomicaceae bacterium]
MKSEKEKSFMQLYEPVHANFEKFCKARVYGEMDFQDLMHDTLLIAYKKFDKVIDPKAFLSFLFGISIRVLSNASKKNKPLLHNDEAMALKISQPNDQTDKKTDVTLLYEALSKLPESQRESIILYEIVGFSVREIAELHNAGESAVKQRLARGRQQLITLLTETKEEIHLKKSVV